MGALLELLEYVKNYFEIFMEGGYKLSLMLWKIGWKTRYEVSIN